MPYVEPRLVFCHNDLSPQNIIYDSITRNVAFLHLEYADVNFQAFEIARHFYTLSGNSDLSNVGCAELVPAREFQMRWCQHYLAAFNDSKTVKYPVLSDFVREFLMFFETALKKNCMEKTWEKKNF